ncbi:MAG: activator-dependent family glycosyltransferase [Kibdelosporangium sp.]
MRILFTINPGTATFNCMVPLAWALRTAGHEVRVASQPLFADEITQAGLTAVEVGRDLGVSRLIAAGGETDEEREEVRRGLPWPYHVVEEPANADWHGLQVAWHHTVQHAKFEVFAMTSSLVEFARHWQPDLVLWEPFTPVGAIAAKACGAAHARLLHGVDVFALAREHFLRLEARQAPEDRGDPLADWLGGYARKYGGEFTEDMARGHFTIDQLPPGLQVEADDTHYVRTHYVPYGGTAVVPKWLHTAPERPRVALTLGTTATEHFTGYAVSVRDILDALSDLDIEVVGTISQSEQEKLGRVPDNARLVPYVPLHALAPTCSAAIHHAGFGTLSTFTRYGVPQLTLPYHFDEPILGRRLTEQGAGLDIDSAAATGETVRDSVLQLLNEPTFGKEANRLRDEIHATPTPNELVGRLEELTTKYRPR